MSRRLTRRTWAALAILLLAIPALMAVFVCVWDERKYYLTSLLLVGLMFVPFVLRFEGRRPQARELVLLSTMTALAVAGRAAFYWLPQCKPVCAIVILTAVAFTPEAGFVTGAAAGLISNFFFGQGPWTPWQMVSWGLIGFISGVVFVRYDLRGKKDLKNNSSFITLIASVILFEVTGYLFVVFTGRDMADTKGIMLYIFGLAGLITGGLLLRKRLKTDSIVMAVFTFLVIFIIYGGIMNFAALIMQSSYTKGTGINLAALKALYITGVPYDIMHAATAALCVFLIGEPFLKKIERVQIKYGIYRM